MWLDHPEDMNFCTMALSHVLFRLKDHLEGNAMSVRKRAWTTSSGERGKLGSRDIPTRRATGASRLATAKERLTPMRPGQN